MVLFTNSILSLITTKAKTTIEDILDIIRYRELLRNLISRELTVRYKRSILGFLWTMLNPLLMMIIFTAIFSTIFRFAVKNFTIYFLSAYLLWNFFAQTTLFSMSVLLANSTMLKRVYMPRSIFVVAYTLSGLVNLMLAMIPLLLIIIVTAHPLQPAILFLPIPLILATIFTLGISLMLSALAIFFHDVIQIYQVLLTAWMYLTPIVYPIEIIPPEYLFLIQFNPMYYLVELFRAPIYQGILPDLSFLYISVTAAFFTLALGWWIFSRSADRFVYYL